MITYGWVDNLVQQRRHFRKIAAIFVNGTEEFLRQLVHYFLSISHQCYYTQTIVRILLNKPLTENYSLHKVHMPLGFGPFPRQA